VASRTRKTNRVSVSAGAAWKTRFGQRAKTAAAARPGRSSSKIRRPTANTRAIDATPRTTLAYAAMSWSDRPVGSSSQ
jgi:hypothetical protein